MPGRELNIRLSWVWCIFDIQETLKKYGYKKNMEAQS